MNISKQEQSLARNLHPSCSLIFSFEWTLHDGAIIQRNRIAAAGCLYSARFFKELGRAQGVLGEVTDAVTIIGEETVPLVLRPMEFQQDCRLKNLKFALEKFGLVKRQRVKRTLLSGNGA